MKKLLIIIPAYNEEESIKSVVEDINKIKSSLLPIHTDILVVNDCSKDKTSIIAHTLNCIVLDLPINLGIGGGMHAGYKFAYKNNYDYAIQVDGDGQHPAKEIPNVLSEVLSEKFNIAIGSRFIQRQGFQSTFLRRIGIKYFKWLNKILIGKTIHDATSGFRVFDRKAIELANKYYPDEYPEPEAIVYFSLHSLRIGEIPVNMLERQGGTTSITSIKSIYYMFKVTLATFFVYLRFRYSTK